MSSDEWKPSTAPLSPHLKAEWQLAIEVMVIALCSLKLIYRYVLAVERLKNKQAAADRLHKLLEESMDSCFTQASPPPYRDPLSTPPPPSPPSLKRKRDQKLSSGGEIS